MSKDRIKTKRLKMPPVVTAHSLSEYVAAVDRIAAQWVTDYALQSGAFDVLKVNPLLVAAPPTPTQMGGAYQRLVRDTRKEGEAEQACILCVYNNPLCDQVDNYNASAYYEPSYYLAHTFENGEF